MTGTRRTEQTARVMATFADGARLYGLEISRLTGLPRATVFGILRRLVYRGRLVQEIEDGDPVVLGRPLRHYYRATGVPEPVTAGRSPVWCVVRADEVLPYLNEDDAVRGFASLYRLTGGSCRLELRRPDGEVARVHDPAE